MKYCVIKDTTKIINNNESIEVLLKDASSVGFTESEVEILTEQEYQARVENEPVTPHSLTETEQLRADVDYIAIMTGVDL